MNPHRFLPAALVTAMMAISPLVSSAGTPGRASSPSQGASLGGSTRILSIPAVRPEGRFDATAYQQAQFSKFESLAMSAAPVTPESLTIVRPSEELLSQLDDDNCTTCGDGVSSTTRRVRVGVNVTTGIGVDFTDIDTVMAEIATMRGAGAVSHRSGVLRPDLASDQLVWTKAIESPGASAMRVHFTDVDLPTGAELYVYNLEGEAFGPYTGKGPNADGEFWSNTLLGEVAYVQVHMPGAHGSRDVVRGTHFAIEDIAHMDDRFLIASIQMAGETSRTCSFNASCVEDANCVSSGTFSGMSDAKAGVAHMVYGSGRFQYMCSGGLLADTDSSSNIPYFLTANHCISRGKEASSLECYWFYQTSGCGATCTSPYGATPRTLGSSILSTSATADYSFLRLSQQPPSGTVFLGWDATPIANSNNATLHRVSHPQGAPASYSQHSVDTSAGQCSSWPRGPWIYSDDTIGATEGGSSGSPVLNAAGQVVGQLSGACGPNPNDSCDSRNATVDGALAYYFGSVEGYLNPGNGGGGDPGDGGGDDGSGGGGPGNGNGNGGGKPKK